MPFTLSHAAAVLPGLHRTGTARGPLIAAALVAGSFAPDLTYFADSVIPGAMRFGEVTHSLPGVLTVDVLITAALTGGWLLVREPLVALLPRHRQDRVYAVVRGRPLRPRGPRELAASACWFFVSAVIGAATHVVWDAFTHAGRWGTRLVPVLNQMVGGIPLSASLQYATSALALAALGWFLWTALRETPASGGDGRPAGTVPGAGPAAIPVMSVRARLLLTLPVLLCVVAGAVQRTVRAHAVYGDAATWFDYVPSVLFGGGAGLIVGLALYAAAVRLRCPSRTEHRPARD
ncbi:DUF4184 family protein [Streptomyces pinistramenti]|uniref:DUF4184 family protein n=1 Tax=Streptomyces pinistramenti TaxID=2884812 RepID=UPI001D086F78|nr:DUF4184 family protein [Streptomyces pinistramenti]MCB5907189.1 DUF4184 family protein [Streptomyces pinistramenti]